MKGDFLDRKFDDVTYPSFKLKSYVLQKGLISYERDLKLSK